MDSRRTRWIVGVVGIACFVALVMPAVAAEWSKAKSTRLRDNCTLECGGSVDATHKPKCPVYCGCIADEAQKVLTEAEYDEMDEKVRIPNTYNPKLPDFVAVIPICRKWAWPDLVRP
jgi:hypothetical protein